MSKALTRGAGVLLPIASLPSDYGIGTLGNAAFSFVDLLVDLRQKYWQVLPIVIPQATGTVRTSLFPCLQAIRI